MLPMPSVTRSNSFGYWLIWPWLKKGFRLPSMATATTTKVKASAMQATACSYCTLTI